MSGIKKRKSSSNMQNGYENAFKNGFRRFIIRSDENGRYIGVYYTAPNGEILKNTNDVIDWLDKNENEININRSNFNFISKKLTKDEENENFIDQNNLPTELIDFVLQKKKSIAPGITGIDEVISHSVTLEHDSIEPEEKKYKSILQINEVLLKNNEVISDTNEVNLENNKMISDTNEVNLENNEVNLEDNKIISDTNEVNMENNEVILDTNEVNLENNEVISDTDEVNLENNKVISNTKEVNLENYEVNLEDNKIISDTNEVNLENNEVISDTDEVNLENNEVILENNEVILEKNEDKLENKEIILENKESKLKKNDGILENIEVISDTDEVFLENNENILENIEVISDTDEVMLENNENIEVISDTDEVMPENNENIEVISDTEEVMLENNENIQENIEIISDTDEVMLENNVNIQENIEILSDTDEVMQENNKIISNSNEVLLENNGILSNTKATFENNEAIHDDKNMLEHNILKNNKDISKDEVILESNKIVIGNKENMLKNNQDTMENNEIILESNEILKRTSPVIERKEENLIFKPVKAYEFPITPMSQQYIFETGNMCYIDKLIESPNLNLPEVMKEFRPYCNNSCAFDFNGLPRITFECDLCLVLWHTDCIGYRWINIELIKLIICDNCFLLQKTNNVQYPNIFCDIEKLYVQEMKSENYSDNRIHAKLEPLLKLYKVQKYLNQNNQKKLKTAKKISKNESECLNSKCKHFYRLQITEENVLHEMKEEIINIKYNQENIDRLSKIFADSECRLRINDKNFEIITSRLTIKKGEIFIPVKTRIMKPCSAIFYTIEHGQDENDAYRYRCEELKTALLESYFSKFQHNDGKIMKLTKDSTIRPIQLTPVLPTVGPGNRFKIISSHFILPRSNSIINSSVLKSNPTQLSNQIPNFIKLRKRKQDFGNQKCLMQAHNYMRNKQFHLLNLPFPVLERILSSNLLSTEDKLNCRVTCRVLKCIIDGSQVWRKLVINPNSITGLENMLNYFRTKYVKKITFNVDFQESFGMEFLLSLFSRLKMYPEYMSFEKLSIKFMGSVNLQTPSQLSIHDILSSCKSLKNLSISSENPFVLAMSKKKLTSNSLEKLKLKNIQNIYYIIQTNAQLTPNLRKLFCGDWSFVTNIEQISLTQITNMEMYISHTISMSDMSGLSMLTNLEILSISRPLINDNLMNLLVYILQPKRLRKFTLNTLVPSKNSYDSCYKLSRCFPKIGVNIIWKIELESAMKFPDRNHIKSLSKDVQEILTNNVKLIYSTPTSLESNSKNNHE